jgi:hypothetical protein
MPLPDGAHYDIMIRCESRNRENDALLTCWCILDSLARSQAGKSRDTVSIQEPNVPARALAFQLARAG